MYKLIILAILISTNVYAGLFDSFKDPATLILNQKDCRLGNYPAEIIDGKLIVGLGVAAVLKKLDKNRITYENQNTNPKSTAVLIVEVRDGWVQAGYTQERIFLGCRLK